MAFAVVGSASMLACGSGDARWSDTAPMDVTFLTFNTALGVGLSEYPDQRLDVITEDLPELEADVLCLQEVWQPEQVEQLAAALEQQLPYAYWSVAPWREDAAGPACTEAEIHALTGCLMDNCSDVSESELPLCAVRSCAGEFMNASLACQQCIVANQSIDVASVIAACALPEGVAAYRDQNGLVLLSRLPLEDLDYRVFDSSLGDRGVLLARVDQPLLPSLTVLCTHLAATQREVPYTGDYQSWEGERAHQIDQLLAYVRDRREGEHAVALMGDMNCGPETARAAAADPAAFDTLTAAGFASPYAQDDSAACTFCLDNPLVGAAEGADSNLASTTGAILDHVMLSGLPDKVDVSSRRVLDDRIEIEVDGETVETSRSDHYGVLVTVEGPKP
ncbi:MAG: endonuclease/exonuclease/phosphatase family protein [Polyangiaceae bacterium]|nr:endonuclease/exonuclease/phosphatase family protein [Polyangiaceae bacterium]